MILGSTGIATLPFAAAPDFVPEPGIPTCFRRPWGVRGLDAPDLTAVDPGGRAWLMVSGNPLLDSAVLGRQLARSGGQRAPALLDALQARGVTALDGVDGAFALAWFDGADLHLFRDRVGAEPLFYAQLEQGIVFGSRARDVVRGAKLPRTVSSAGLAEYLTYAYVPGTRTLYDDVMRVPAGGRVRFSSRPPHLEMGRWYRLSYAGRVNDEGEIRQGFRDRLETAVIRRLGGGRTGTFLSGGMDSSSAITFARRHTEQPIHSFGFRCSGNSFDESFYARSLAEQLSVEHTEVEYGEAESLSILDAIEQMEVPFCDIGIEVGTWIMARAAGAHVDYVLTGDGGDEIWGSHPVYAAQKLMGAYDLLPLSVRRVLVAPTRLVRDSDSKRNLAVIAKRLLPHPNLDPRLGHFRWRTYFTREELDRVAGAELASRIREYDTYAVVRASLEDYDGPDDNLSRWMYSDYTTAAGFYCSRLLLARAFGVEARTPFFDRDLVEFGARIPAGLKLEGVERTKRLFREAMEGTLPDVINHRRDKLGHSVPLKNWLRGGGALGQQVAATLRSEQFRERGILRDDAVERLLEEHAARRDNHSHRLWGLFVLEHWLRRHID